MSKIAELLNCADRFIDSKVFLHEFFENVYDDYLNFEPENDHLSKTAFRNWVIKHSNYKLVDGKFYKKTARDKMRKYSFASKSTS